MCRLHTFSGLIFHVRRTTNRQRYHCRYSVDIDRVSGRIPGDLRPGDPVINSSRLLNSIYEPDVLVYPQNETIENACGTLGAWMADMLVHVLGIGAYYLVLGMVVLEVLLFRHRGVRAPWFKLWAG